MECFVSGNCPTAKPGRDSVVQPEVVSVHSLGYFVWHPDSEAYRTATILWLRLSGTHPLGSTPPTRTCPISPATLQPSWYFLIISWHYPPSTYHIRNRCLVWHSALSRDQQIQVPLPVRTARKSYPPVSWAPNTPAGPKLLGIAVGLRGCPESEF